MYLMYFLTSSLVKSSIGPIEKARSMNLSSSSTIFSAIVYMRFLRSSFQISRFSSIYSRNNLIIDSACIVSSTIDQVTICPMPFILPCRGKFSSIMNEENNCIPSVNAENAAMFVANVFLSTSALDISMKYSCLSFIASYSRNSLYVDSGIPRVSMR